MAIKITPLGAGQDVGRSCILVSMGGKNIMLDCGFHMGFHDHRRFPDFSFISRTGNFTRVVDCVIVSHFHLDHCGALPYFTEELGYDGPIYMTHPTKAICPILLEDFVKVSPRQAAAGTPSFTSAQIKKCMSKVTGMQLHQSVYVDKDKDFEIKVYYAGHVLGAGMFHVRVGTESIVYTGDFNMTADQHLGAAWIDKVRPDVLITESTYGTTIRDSKRSRERDFLKKVHDCVLGGGKVLIPCFALGRAQELCILIDSYWDRMDLKVPVYFSTGLTSRANEYYKLFINWSSQKIRTTFVERNMFDFKHIQAWQRGTINHPGPFVVFATPGMLHQGTSLEIFGKIAPDPKNMIIMPGFCVAGTIGHQVLRGAEEVQIDGRRVPVNLQVRNLSFSAHADAKGIMQLIRNCEPRHVVLVHGELHQMQFLAEQVKTDIGVPCLYPANGETIELQSRGLVRGRMSLQLLNAAINEHQKNQWHQKAQLAATNSNSTTISTISTINTQKKGLRVNAQGVLLVRPNENGSDVELISHNEYKQLLRKGASDPLHILDENDQNVADRRPRCTLMAVREYDPLIFAPGGAWCPSSPFDAMYLGLSHGILGTSYATLKLEHRGMEIKAGNVSITPADENAHQIHLKWPLYDDQEHADFVLGIVTNVLAGVMGPQHCQ
ncbi:beta-lactamase-like protein [Gongronella butleri]|nr:beta-lactamase-like protein [Gongronella butleri]